MEEEEIPSTANSEIRFITLELMRIAQKSGRSFDELAEEFIRNTVRMQDLISGAADDGIPPAKAKRRSKAWQK
ncbi:MAG: hypothetical protein WCT52_04110 [Candidatus Micrarchaeia archaeon]|jgi:hypothetical protein